MAIRITPTTATPSSQFTAFITPRVSPFLIPKLKILPTTISCLPLLTTPKDVNTFTLPKDQIISSLTKVESTIDHIQQVGTGVLDFSQQKLEVVIKLARPILQKSGDQALKIASPVIEEVSKKTQEAIQSTGIDTQPFHTVAKTVGDVAREAFEIFAGAKPIALSALETIWSSEPVLIVEASGGLFVSFLVLPPIWSAVSFNFRGYKGKLSPAQTLDLLSRRNYFMIDVRLHNEKHNAGVPLLPSTAKNKMASIPAEELPRKVKDLVRNTKEVEAGITALKIAHLKMIGTHSNIVIMDSYCDMAKSVARELTKLGFKNCWVVSGGFSGNQGWSQSYLGKKLYNVSPAEVLSVPPIISPVVQKDQSDDKVSS